MNKYYPDFVPISTWIEWQSIEWKNDVYSKILSISMVSGKPLDEVRNVPINELADLYVKSIEKLTEGSNPIFAIKYKGQELYFSAPHLATIGEVADIEAFLASEQPYEILKVLFRPVKNDSTGVEWTKLNDDISVKYITSFEENYASYTVKKYNIDKIKGTKFNTIEFWADFPSSVYSSVVDFIAGVGISSLIHFENYSKELEPEKMKELIARLTMAGAGFRAWSVWQKVTFSESQETIESPTSTLDFA